MDAKFIEPVESEIDPRFFAGIRDREGDGVGSKGGGDEKSRDRLGILSIKRGGRVAERAFDEDIALNGGGKSAELGEAIEERLDGATGAEGKIARENGVVGKKAGESADEAEH